MCTLTVHNQMFVMFFVFVVLGVICIVLSLFCFTQGFRLCHTSDMVSVVT